MRETGYYWCCLNTTWSIFYYNKFDNTFTGGFANDPYYDGEFNEIDEKQIKRE